MWQPVDEISVLAGFNVCERNLLCVPAVASVAVVCGQGHILSALIYSVYLGKLSLPKRDGAVILKSRVYIVNLP